MRIPAGGPLSIPVVLWSVFWRNFIECGFDIFNPVQCSAANMDRNSQAEIWRPNYLLGWSRGYSEDPAIRNHAAGSGGSVKTLRNLCIERGFVINSMHNVKRTPVEKYCGIDRRDSRVQWCDHMINKLEEINLRGKKNYGGFKSSETGNY